MASSEERWTGTNRKIGYWKFGEDYSSSVPGNPKRPGYIFKKWLPETNGTTCWGAKTFRAQWKYDQTDSGADDTGIQSVTYDGDSDDKPDSSERILDAFTIPLDELFYESEKTGTYSPVYRQMMEMLGITLPETYTYTARYAKAFYGSNDLTLEGSSNHYILLVKGMQTKDDEYYPVAPSGYTSGDSDGEIGVTGSGVNHVQTVMIAINKVSSSDGTLIANRAAVNLTIPESATSITITAVPVINHGPWAYNGYNTSIEDLAVTNGTSTNLWFYAECTCTDSIDQEKYCGWITTSFGADSLNIWDTYVTFKSPYYQSSGNTGFYYAGSIDPEHKLNANGSYSSPDNVTAFTTWHQNDLKVEADATITPSHAKNYGSDTLWTAIAGSTFGKWLTSNWEKLKDSIGDIVEDVGDAVEDIFD